MLGCPGAIKLEEGTENAIEEAGSTKGRKASESHPRPPPQKNDNPPNGVLGVRLENTNPFFGRLGLSRKKIFGRTPKRLLRAPQWPMGVPTKMHGMHHSGGYRAQMCQLLGESSPLLVPNTAGLGHFLDAEIG